MNHRHLDVNLPIAQRVNSLIEQMTLQEKVSQMLHESPAIERLAVPEYNWWNECLHGVARAGVATVFPQAIGMAATWNTELVHKVATAISDEARAKHHEALRNGNRGQYFGLTYWTPNINIFRDPRWGRGHETWGECPWLTARMGVAFVQGLQGDDPNYLKLVATPKHYAVHSGPENERHGFDAIASPKDLRETYLPAFKATVQEAKAVSIMGAYNRTNGEVCCGSPTLLQKILRDEWGFDGYVVSDCGAICDFHQHHKVTRDAAESAALAVNNGCELCCGKTYDHLLDAVQRGLLSEETIDRAVGRLMSARFRLGMFDPPERVLYASIPASVNDSAEHRELARRAARESIVLLKNENGLLPLKKTGMKQICVVGPNAGAMDVLLGNYNGLNPRLVTVIEGICGKVGPGTAVHWYNGASLSGDSTAGFNMALIFASQADVIVAVMGLAPRLEGEEGDTADSDGGGDRRHLDLPGVQEEFLKQLHATGKPVVLVLLNGSALAVNWAAQNIPAILTAWYPGEEGGNAVADVLFGDYNPAGRLPVTFYKSLEQVPEFRNYSMAERTYRYFTGKPLYPFGHGLSYTEFQYADLNIAPSRSHASDPITVSVNVTNTGERAGDEVVQLYLSDATSPVKTPIRQLAGFRRIHLQPGETQRVQFALKPAQFARTYEDGRQVVEPGRFNLSIGGSQPLASEQDAWEAAECLTASVERLA